MSLPSPLTPSLPQSLSPRLSVVVPLFNCLPLTQAMVAGLRATLPAGLSHEIILVDDGSTDGTRAWLEGLSASNDLATQTEPPFRVLLNERNLGYAISNNRAAAVARGEFLALLNNDLVLRPGWLEPMLEAHARLNGRAGLIGNVQLDARTGAVDHAGLEPCPTGKPVHIRTLPPLRSRRRNPVRIVPAVTAACVLIERNLWRELGGFDEAYVNGGEDIDLCYRARAAGRVNAVALDSVVRHHVSASPGRKARDEQNSYRLARRWHHEFAADAIEPWCRDYLARAWVEPHGTECRLVFAAAAFLARLRPTPPPEAANSIAEGLAREFARWAEMFPQSVDPSPEPVPPALYRPLCTI